jgi:GTP-binding protein
VQFLKHLSRTRLLLHLVDLAPLDETVSPAAQVRQVEQELAKFSADLAGRERWLVLTKRDLLAADDLAERRERLVRELDWQGPLYAVSAVSGEGIDALMGDLMTRLEALRQEEAAPLVADEDEYHPLD